MSGSSAFFILIPAMYVLFALSMCVIALVERRLVTARWAALGFMVACVSITVDGFRDPAGDRWISWFSVATHFIPLLIMVQAFLSRNDQNAPRFAIALTVIACLYTMPNMPWAPPYAWRAILVQAVCATIIASGLPLLWRLRNRSKVDWIVFAAIAGAALSYAGRTVAISFNPIGSTTADVVAFYEGLNMVFHSASALMGMTVGIVLMMTIGYDMLQLRMLESENDPLTKLGNRRRLDRTMTEVENGERQIGSAIVIDLDHFKRVNDVFGHDAGDEVLRAVGAKLLHILGPFGEVCRTGGEEFVILIDEQYSPGTSALALSAREAIAQLKFEDVLAKTTITASVGFHRREGAESVSDSIQRADQAVYCAKSDGRNRVVGSLNEKGLQILKAVA